MRFLLDLEFENFLAFCSSCNSVENVIANCSRLDKKDPKRK